MRDLDALRAAHPIAITVEQSGVLLRSVGRRFVGRCPFHDDHTPSFTVYPHTNSYYCFGCGAGGDTFDFLARAHRLDFRGVLRLFDALSSVQSVRQTRSVPRTARHNTLDSATLAVIDAAATFFRTRLWQSDVALTYLAQRGITEATARAHCLGYATQDGLEEHLCRRGLSLAHAESVGLLREGRSMLAGRIIVPELCGGRATWLTARALGGSEPRYLSLRLSTPLLGRSLVRGDEVVVTEGLFDWLTARQWSLPAVALAGTHASREAVRQLRRFRRVYLALDSDAAGQRATAELCRLLGDQAAPVQLPTGAKDLGELAIRPDGRLSFLTNLRDARRERFGTPGAPGIARYRRTAA